ncbi:tRNA 2-thiocytidine(32) synthetase TtcA [Hydrogenophaga sp. 5NK40-0174]|uniref:tRNA 2-thiocytidine(32) synthetase TtcA n=1 Tax=Hydrogenophaga sp. 5NK40-0174 TaxID=3127649 RepID=UPI0031069142
MDMPATSSSAQDNANTQPQENAWSASVGAKPNSAAKAQREAHKLEKRLCREVGRAIVDYNMIEEGDRIMVCLSGGKDSYGMLDILLKLQARAPVNFELIAVNLDQKQPGFPADVLPNYLDVLGVKYHIENQDTYSIVKKVIPEGKTMCSLCSRLRRGILYRVANELGATKIALGHHRDDILQTLMLNMFFGGKLKGMPPKLVSDNGEHVVIRPLAYVAEKDLIAWADHRQFPIIPCSLCGSQENLQRVQVGNMLREWEKKFPGRLDNMFSALQNVVPSHLMDTGLFPFTAVKATGVADDEGDKAFDDEPLPLSRPDPAAIGDADSDEGAAVEAADGGNPGAPRTVIPIASR